MRPKAKKIELDRVWMASVNISDSAKLLHAEDLMVSVETILRLLAGDCDTQMMTNTWKSPIDRGILVTVGYCYAGHLHQQNGTDRRSHVAAFAGKERYSLLFPDWVTHEMIRGHRASLLRLACVSRATDGKDAWYTDKFPEFSTMTHRELSLIPNVWPVHAREGL